MKFKFFLLAVLTVFLLPGKSFADMPEVSAGKTYFNPLKGYYVLKDNVHVVTKNHGVSMTVDATEARVNLFTQKCWATGGVKLIYDDMTFGCDKIFLQWSTKTANVTGTVKFNDAGAVKINSDTATFDWNTKVADFYGNVKVKAGKKIKIPDGIKVGRGIYSHVKYNVVENEILEISDDIEKVTIPEDPDNK